MVAALWLVPRVHALAETRVLRSMQYKHWLRKAVTCGTGDSIIQGHGRLARAGLLFEIYF